MLQRVPIAVRCPATGACIRQTLCPRTAGAQHRSPLRFDLARPFPQLSNAWFFDRGVIWSEGPDQPAELGSPTAIGNFRDTDRSDSFSAGLAPQPQRFDLPKFRDNFLRAASLSCHSHVLVRIKSAPLRGTVLLTAYRPAGRASMRLFGLLGGGWSINFSQQTLRGNTSIDLGSRRSSGFQLGEGAEPRSGSVLTRCALSRSRILALGGRQVVAPAWLDASQRGVWCLRSRWLEQGA